jgi:hypothetical protein
VIHEVVKNALRVRSPAFKTSPIHAPNPQDLPPPPTPTNADGGRSVDVDFTGTSVSFTDLFFTVPPLTRATTFTVDDAGVLRSHDDVPYPASILNVHTDGTVSEYYTFGTDELEMDHFRSGYGGSIPVNGENLIEPRNLVITTSTDQSGKLYFASNSSLEILVFTTNAATSTVERQVFTTFPSTVGDIKLTSSYLYASLLPVLNVTLTELVTPPKIVRVPLAGGPMEVIGILPASLDRYRQNAKSIDLPNEDGGVTRSYIPTSISFSMIVEADDSVIVTSGKEGVLYRVSGTGVVTVMAEGLTGITSISRSPISDCLYATLPSVVDFSPNADGGANAAYLSYPRVKSICPNGEINDFFVLSTYESITPNDALNGFGVATPDGGVIAISAVSTIASDSNGNLILADPVKNSITAIQIVQ